MHAYYFWVYTFLSQVNNIFFNRVGPLKTLSLAAITLIFNYSNESLKPYFKLFFQ